MSEYKNPPTVVVVVARVNGGLLMVRRKLPDGYRKLALPGGFQVEGETWQEAGVREVREETGILLNPKLLTVSEVVTVENGKLNLLFAYTNENIRAEEPLKGKDDEALEVVIVTESPDPADIAFETHARQARLALDHVFPFTGRDRNSWT